MKAKTGDQSVLASPSLVLNPATTNTKSEINDLNFSNRVQLKDLSAAYIQSMHPKEPVAQSRDVFSQLKASEQLRLKTAEVGGALKTNNANDASHLKMQ